MGYVHDTQMSHFIYPWEIYKNQGTWTLTVTANVVADVRTANDNSFTLFAPIRIPSNGSSLKGAYLKSIDVYYKIGTTLADDFATVELEKQILPALTASAPTGAAVTVTCDTGHDSAAERKAVDSHKMTVTLTTPVWVDDDDYYTLIMIVDAHANTVFTLYGVRANFTLRL